MSTRRGRDVRFVSKKSESDWAQMGQIRDFSDQISICFLAEPKLLKSDLEKKNGFVPFEFNLTHYEVKTGRLADFIPVRLST